MEMRNDTSVSGEISKQKLEKSFDIEKLVEKSIKGDKDSLNALCETIAKSVVFRVTYLMGKDSEAEDVSQEVLIRVCKHISKLRSPKAFKSWLSGIIINETNTWRAKRAKSDCIVRLEDCKEELTDENAEREMQENAENSEIRAAIMDILDSIPIRQREVVMLIYYSGLSLTEAARAMGVKKQTAKNYLTLAQEKLKIKIEKESIGYKLRTMSAIPIGALVTETIFVHNLCNTTFLNSLPIRFDYNCQLLVALRFALCHVGYCTALIKYS